MTDSSITFIGGGNMAACLIEGLLAKGHSPQSIRVSDINSGARKKIEDMFQVTAMSDNVVASKDADIIVLAVKPQTFGEVAKELAPRLRSHSVIVSIAAGISVGQIVRYVGKSASIVRAMPNTPAVVLSGATGLYANPKVLPSQKTAVEKIFSAVGYACWVKDESHIDAITAVSGSAPAYFLLIFETMHCVARELGLPKELALGLIKQTAFGTAKLAQSSSLAIDELRRQVTSPGGTTEAAVKAFQDGGIEDLFRKAMTDAVKRSQEISFDQPV